MKFKKGVLLVFLSVILTLSLTACNSGDNDLESSSEFDGELFFAGSSTLAPTISQIADTFKNEYGTWDKVDESLPATEITISVSTGGSGAGAKAVIDGTANFGMLAREVKAEEKEAIEGFQEFRLGMDALLMAVHKDNELGQNRTDLTTEEIRLIFSDEISHWSEFDSSLPEEEIVLFVRDIGGGAHEVFQDNIMGETDVSNQAIEVPSMSGLVDRLTENSLAIGYASYGIADQHSEELIAFNVDGIEPTSENIINGTYKVSRPLIIVSGGELSVAEEAFLSYIQSESGYSIINEMGFLPAQ